MSILSSSSPTLFFSTANPRVSVSLSPTSTVSTSSSVRSRSIFRHFPYLAFSRAANAAAETFEGKKWSSSSATQPISGSELGYSHTFIDALSEQGMRN
ncbi:putative glycerol-3-phosphate 1-O-acyltransferase [Helianthus annuus]|nr:putative glycerol-3-phosphate 1-O-acyltransferase [Helianthus annuus]